MNERVTLISIFDENNLEKIKLYVDKLDKSLCKVPFGKNVDNRMTVDTLPYHFTLSAWNIDEEQKVVMELSKIQFINFKIIIDKVEIMSGKENSYILYFNVCPNKELRLLQEAIYKVLPTDKYNPENFNYHITIHIDKDYDKILRMKNILSQGFVPFELEVSTFGLFEIYPAKIVKYY